MNTDWILYFGYGSLVNRNTRPAGEVAHSARLRGWQRVWDHRVTDPNRDKQCTSLSIEPAPGMAIEGVVVRLEADGLPQLDERESGYDRLCLSVSDFDLPVELMEQMASEGVADSIMVYRSQPQNRFLADTHYSILQSYIDCVMAGYLYRFGEEGVQDLVRSTRGWERSVCNDRIEPFYPRWVQVSQADQHYFDDSVNAHLKQQGQQRLA
ncbi:gamma-glutamylcyclotransferase family protein [Granulosicoccus antarcticus]|uniref:Gamma-glutamylcyclotransferase AIG2-like domain-containing protein n=1 Tax=Granulosicoccus antarcticus IMCC3135 TaxID=1192854 RepID=A0A2Z2NVU5_9GAMM|nr:gamma-glutamylcyclotransferase family protein [Granulosicoccus antarcticus]ASJ72910.1 hypothetical protein IMCC3135_14125 [Granulosicoccus antarcticus IMCC3135]